MRVGMYYNNQDVRVEEMAKPAIGRGEMLVKVKASGICGSDLMEWYRIKKAPLVLGHEITAEIVELGRGIKDYNIGERIFAAHHVPCDNCRYCLSGNHTACPILHTTNYYPGGFSEYIRIPSLNIKRGLLRLPQEVSFEEGTFIEPLACVLRGQRAVNFLPGQTVFILGSGISGLLHLLLARSRGASRIILTDINEYRMRKAKELGADAVINAEEDIVSKLHENNEGRLADIVIICTSATSAFNQALQTVGPAGSILCFAPTHPGVTLNVPVNEFWRNQIKIIHSYGSSPQDNAQALELLKLKKIDVSKLVTHRLKLSQINKGFQLMREGKEAIKIILEP